VKEAKANTVSDDDNENQKKKKQKEDWLAPAITHFYQSVTRGEMRRPPGKPGQPDATINDTIHSERIELMLKDEVECSWQLLLLLEAIHSIPAKCGSIGSTRYYQTRHDQWVWQNHPQMMTDTWHEFQRGKIDKLISQPLGTLRSWHRAITAQLSSDTSTSLYISAYATWHYESYRQRWTARQSTNACTLTPRW
jgi:hypothetical protein